MNLAPVTANTAPPPADAPRSSEPAHAEEFSDVLSQQQGQVREHGTATTHTASKSAQTTASAEERDAPAPDETLALLAAGAVLPMMTTRAELTGAVASQRGTHMTNTTVRVAATAGSAADAARTILADAQALVSGATAQHDAAGIAPISTTGRRAESIPLAATELHSDQTATPSTRAHAALAPAATAAQLAARTSGAKSDAAQAAFTQIAAAIGLNTQPAATLASTSAIDSRAIQDAVNAMAGAAQAQGSSTTLPTTTLLSSPAVATPLSNPAWAADFSRQFVSMTQGRDMSQPHTIELRLDPPSLGPVRITLHISDSIAQAAFVSPHLVVRQAIENALPQLQQQLAEAGLSLGQASVNDQQAGQQGFEQSSSQGSPRSRSVFSLDGGSVPHTSSSASLIQRQATRSPDALVDTFA